MSGALDEEARQAAFDALDEFGKACTLNKLTVGAYDPETSSAPSTPTAYSINLFLDDPNAQELAGGQVLHTDEIAIFPAHGLSVEPAPNDTITVDGKARIIRTVGRVWSGAQVALWRCALKS